MNCVFPTKSKDSKTKVITKMMSHSNLVSWAILGPLQWCIFLEGEDEHKPYVPASTSDVLGASVRLFSRSEIGDFIIFTDKGISLLKL
jgi:hypothetical protein